MNFCFNKTTQIIVVCLLFISVQLSAQSGSGTTYSQRVYVTEKLANKETKSTQYEGAEANAFDIEEFIEKNIYQKDFTIRSVVKTDLSLTYHNFNSKSYTDADDCRNFCEQVESVEKLPYLGVAAGPIDDFEGVLIETVINKGAAQKAGIQLGDIITHLGEDEIRSGCELAIAVRSHAVGERVQVRYIRDADVGAESIDVVLGYRLKETITYVPCCNDEIEIAADLEAGDLKVENKTIKLFPNPSFGITNVLFESTDITPITITITDMSGKQIMQKQIDDFDGYLNQSLDLRDKPDGIYFLNVIQGENIYVEKIVITRA